MTAFEFEQCRQLAEKWWPGIWSQVSLEHDYADVVRKFERISFTAGKRAIDQLADQGESKYPTLGQFLRVAREVQSHLPKVAESPETCRHVWGVLPEWEQRQERERQGKPESVRLSVCALCRSEDWSARATVGEARTKGERTEAA